MEIDDRGLARLVRENPAKRSVQARVGAVSAVLENYRRRAGPDGVAGIVITAGVPYGDEALDTLIDAGVLSVPDDYDPSTSQDPLLMLDDERLKSYLERSNVYDDPRLRRALGLHAKDGPMPIETSDAVAGGMYELLTNFARSGSERLSLREFGGKHAHEAARQLEDLGVLAPVLEEQGLGRIYSVDEERLNVLVERCAPYQ